MYLSDARAAFADSKFNVSADWTGVTDRCSWGKGPGMEEHSSLLAAACTPHLRPLISGQNHNDLALGESRLLQYCVNLGEFSGAFCADPRGTNDYWPNQFQLASFQLN